MVEKNLEELIEGAPYANNALPNQFRKPTVWLSGVKVGDTIPAVWWNWMWNKFSKAHIESVHTLDSLCGEILSVLEHYEVDPNPDETNQLLSCLQKLKMGLSDSIGELRTEATEALEAKVTEVLERITEVETSLTDKIDALQTTLTERIDNIQTEIKPATKTSLGLVKIGRNLRITDDGTLSSEGGSVSIATGSDIVLEDNPALYLHSVDDSEPKEADIFVPSAVYTLDTADNTIQIYDEQLDLFRGLVKQEHDINYYATKECVARNFLALVIERSAINKYSFCIKKLQDSDKHYLEVSTRDGSKSISTAVLNNCLFVSSKTNIGVGGDIPAPYPLNFEFNVGYYENEDDLSTLQWVGWLDSGKPLQPDWYDHEPIGDILGEAQVSKLLLQVRHPNIRHEDSLINASYTPYLIWCENGLSTNKPDFLLDKPFLAEFMAPRCLKVRSSIAIIKRIPTKQYFEIGRTA